MMKIDLKMKSRRLGNLLLYSFLTIIIPFAPSKAEECTQKQVSQFGTGSIFDSLKRTPFYLNMKVLTAILKENPKEASIMVPEFKVKTESKQFKTTRDVVFETAQSWKERTGALFTDFDLSPRDFFIRDALTSFFSVNSERADTLRVAFAGVAHAVDYQLFENSASTTFITSKFDLETPLYSPGWQVLVQHQGDDIKIVRDDLSSFLLGVEISVLKNINREEIMARIEGREPKKFATESRRQSNNNAIFIADFHGVRSDDAISILESASCLRARGIKTITFAIEGLRADKVWKAEDIFDLATSKIEMKKSAYVKGLSVDNYLKKYFTKDLISIYKSNQLIFNPQLYSLSKKILEYKDQGLKIEILGIEPNY